MASARDHRAHAALQPADCLVLLPQPLPAAVEPSIGPAHYPAECTQSDAFLQPSLRARKGRANSNSFSRTRRLSPLKDRAMKLLSRWFRREPTEPSWIDPVVLAARIEGEAALLVLDVRGPDAAGKESTGQ